MVINEGGKRESSVFNLIQVDPDRPVLVAGDPEKFHESTVQEEGGIWYHDALILAVVRRVAIRTS